MPLIGLTSEVDTPDWADKGVHSMPWWLSHGEHIQKAINRVGLCSSLSVNDEKQHRSMKKDRVQTSWSFALYLVWTICSSLSVRRLFKTLFTMLRSNIFLIWIEFIWSTSKWPFSHHHSHPAANGTHLDKKLRRVPISGVVAWWDFYTLQKHFPKLMLSSDFTRSVVYTNQCRWHIMAHTVGVGIVIKILKVVENCKTQLANINVTWTETWRLTVNVWLMATNMLSN